MPEGDSPIPLDAETQLVIRQLRDVAARCIDLIRNPPGNTDRQKSWHASQAAAKLASINKQLDQVKGKLANVAAKKIVDQYSKGIRDTEAHLRQIGLIPDNSPVHGSFTQVDRRRAQVLAQQTVGDLSKAVDSIKANTGKLVRQCQADGIDNKKINQILAGSTIEGMPAKSLRELKDEIRKIAVDGKIITINKQTGVVMHFKPDDYAELVFQTKLAETTNIATLQRLAEKSIFYVKIIGSNSRNFCTAFVSRVFWSGPGEDPKGVYPSVRDLPHGGPPFHPRCTKRYVAFISKLASPEEIANAKLKPGERELLKKSPGEAQKLYQPSPNKSKPLPAPEILQKVTADAKDARRVIQEIGDGFKQRKQTLESYRDLVGKEITRAIDAGNDDMLGELVPRITEINNDLASINADRLKSIRDVIRTDNPIKVSAIFDPALGEGRINIAKKGIAELEKLVDRNLIDTLDIIVRPPERKYLHLRRSYYRDGKLFISTNATVHTIIHELGHALEDALPNMLKNSVRFLARRTAGQKLETLNKLTNSSQFEVYEKAWPDDFYHLYVGKQYAHGTEITSMGVEAAWFDAQWFAKADPDHFEFVYKVLRGVPHD